MSATPQGNHAALPPRGACGSPAAPAVTRVHPCAGGGGLFIALGLHRARTLRPRESGGISNREVGVSTA